MADLLPNILLNRKLTAKDFKATQKEATVFSCLYIEDEGVILVEEWVLSSKEPLLYWTFFNIKSLEKIETEIRYNQENNKIWQVQLDSTKSMTCRIEVNKDNGCETLFEQVFDNNVMISNTKRARYPNRGISKLDKLTLGLAFSRNKKSNIDKFIKDFLSANEHEKFFILNALFINAINSHKDSGFTPVEAFLHKSVLEKIKNDPLFESTLVNVLESNREWLKKDISTLYNIVLSNLL